MVILPHLSPPGAARDTGQEDPTPGLAHIDFVRAVIPCHHFGRIDGGIETYRGKDGELYERPKYLFVKGPGGGWCRVVSHQTGSSLEVLFNPAKWEQGHNIFGPSHLTKSVADLMAYLANVNDRIRPTAADFRAIAKGEDKLARVDCAASYPLDELDGVRAKLKQLQQNATLRGKAAMNDRGTLYWMRESRYYHLAAYAKGPEVASGLKGHRLLDTLLMREWLIAHAMKLLRVELQLERKLKYLGLDKASAWTAETPTKLLRETLRVLDVGDAPSLRAFLDSPFAPVPEWAIGTSLYAG